MDGQDLLEGLRRGHVARWSLWISRMATVAEPRSVTTGVGAVSQRRNRSGTWSSGSAMHHQQMNRAWFSSGHGVGRCRGRSMAVLSAASVAAEGGPSPSKGDQSVLLIGAWPGPSGTHRQVRATRLSAPKCSRSFSMACSTTSRGQRDSRRERVGDVYGGHRRLPPRLPVMRHVAVNPKPLDQPLAASPVQGSSPRA
jgi:hypothetical protein